MVEGFIQKVENGELRQDDAQVLAQNALSAARFGKGNSIFLYNTQGACLTCSADPFNTQLFGELAENAAKGGGYAQARLEKPGSQSKYDATLYSEQVPTWNWVIGTSYARGDTLSHIMSVIVRLTLIVAPLLAGFSVLAWKLGNGVAQPLDALTGSMRRLSEGELDISIKGAGRADEIGDIAIAVERFRKSLRLQADTERMKETARAAQAEKERRSMLMALAQEFEMQVQSAGQTMRAALKTASKRAEEAEQIADQAAMRAEVASKDGADTTRASEAASEASTEVENSTRHISEQIGRASEISVTTLQEAEDSATASEELSDAAEEIASVISIIHKIADQTNLLALNATIEAASAGEAGRGFAIVAHEVKELATQTTKATEEISTRILAIRSASKNSKEVAMRIAERTRDMRNIANAIAAAADEQCQTTDMLGDNVRHTASAASDTFEVLNSMSSLASQTSSAAESINAAMSEASNEADKLDNAVTAFVKRLAS